MRRSNRYEDSDSAEFARSDPKGFLMRYPAPLVIDEAQRVPGLMSSLQVAVDSRRDAMGQYVLTGSHQSLLKEKVSQSLAGRTAILDLLPLSLAELGAIADGLSADEIMLKGFMPNHVPWIHAGDMEAGCFAFQILP